MWVSVKILTSCLRWSLCVQPQLYCVHAYVCMGKHVQCCFLATPGYLHTERGRMFLNLKLHKTVIDLMDHINHWGISTNANTEFYFMHNAYQSSVSRTTQALNLKEKQALWYRSNKMKKKKPTLLTMKPFAVYLTSINNLVLNASRRINFWCMLTVIIKPQ